MSSSVAFSVAVICVIVALTMKANGRQWWKN